MEIFGGVEPTCTSRVPLWRVLNPIPPAHLPTSPSQSEHHKRHLSSGSLPCKCLGALIRRKISVRGSGARVYLACTIVAGASSPFRQRPVVQAHTLQHAAGLLQPTHPSMTNMPGKYCEHDPNLDLVLLFAKTEKPAGCRVAVLGVVWAPQAGFLFLGAPTLSSNQGLSPRYAPLNRHDQAARPTVSGNDTPHQVGLKLSAKPD
jgi:hypothetical protein